MILSQIRSYFLSFYVSFNRGFSVKSIKKALLLSSVTSLLFTLPAPKSFAIGSTKEFFSEASSQFHSNTPAKKWNLNRLAKAITAEKYPLLALYAIWQKQVKVVDQELACPSYASPLDYLNFSCECSLPEFTSQFIKLCHLLGIDSRRANVEGKVVYDFCLEKDHWIYLDLKNGEFYLSWDNTALLSSEQLMDDPLLVLRSKVSRDDEFDLQKSWLAFSRLKIIGFELQQSGLCGSTFSMLSNQPPLKQEDNTSSPPLTPQSLARPSALFSLNHEKKVFDYAPVVFDLNNNSLDHKKIHWQISADKEFKVVAFSLEKTQPLTSSLSLSLLEQTFLNANETYYLRIQQLDEKGVASVYSAPLAFVVKKPAPLNMIEFEKIAPHQYELNWERDAEADEAVEYYIFGSNAFDFIPSIYTPLQINEMSEENIVDKEECQNLVAITKEKKLIVDGSLAYYRIIAKKAEQFSVPSPIVHVYDSDLVQPRTVAQMSTKNSFKRQLFPASYPWTENENRLCRLGVMNRLYDNSLLELHSFIAKTVSLQEQEAAPFTPYQKPAHVSKELWKKMKPYFLPENHPWKAKIDRIFSASRASKNGDSLIQAGFRGKVTHVRKIFAGTHAACPDCFFKIYTDSEVTSRYTEWQKWLDRIKGRNNVLKVIRKRGLQKWFSVPDKWCYPLPETPAAPSSPRYRPKDFILVASNQKPYDSYENAKLWKTKMTPELLDALYIVLDEAGMWDSMFIFNIPFSKIGNKICFVDTEYSHKWPLRFEKLSKYLSSQDRKYWEYLIKNRGPKGYSRQVS